MIDISLMAPAVQTPAGLGAPATTNPTNAAPPGTKGFLRLFEIVLDGMPRPVHAPSEDGSTPLAVDPGSTMVATSTPNGTIDLASLLAPQESLLPQEASERIAELLQGLGFAVDADQIMALGPLDRLQLDQAMEFLQRGLEAGMPANELLENASFLMPREWDYQGPRSDSDPRAEGLAIPGPEAEAVDLAGILAATEAVRGMLIQATSLPSSTGARSEPAGPTEAPTVGATAAPATASAALQAAAAAKVVGNVDIERAVRGSNPGEPAPAAAKSTESDPAVPSEALTESVVPSPGSRPVLHQPSRHERPMPAQTPAVASAQAHAAGPSAATPTVVPSPEAHGSPAPSATAEPPALQADGIATGSILQPKVQAPLPETRLPTAEGVRPGSMASEFIGRQVLEKVDVQLRQGKRELTVRIWPEELGEVRLSLRLGEADKLDARILVQTEGVRQALLDATPQLREALARHGMEMGRLSVGVDSGRPEAQMAGGQHRDPQGRDGGRETPRRGWREQEIEYAGALALGVDSGIRDGRNTLDMWS